jgi:ketosteroid isomerase-like protein
MSQENVELIRGLLPRPEVDIAQWFRDDKVAEAVWMAAAPVFHDDFDCINVTPGQRSTYRGSDGLRAFWLDWLSPWDSYYTTIENVVDRGDRVLVQTRDHGRRKDLAAAVELLGTAVYTVRDGKVARIEYYSNRDEALEAVGLAEQDANADS